MLRQLVGSEIYIRDRNGAGRDAVFPGCRPGLVLARSVPFRYNRDMTQGESFVFVFVSYTSADEKWATWIASALEGAGLAARVQV